MRRTEEGYFVSDTDMVFEIVWQYLNAEYSEAVPRRAMCHEVPAKYKVWKWKWECSSECKKLNEENKKKIDKLVRDNYNNTINSLINKLKEQNILL